MPDRCTDVVVCVDVLEHVEDLAQVVAEIARVLRPGGLLLFDTINRTFLARFVMITLGERVLRLLPPGTHDPAKFITPPELRALLRREGMEISSMEGIGPRSLNRRLDLCFGRYPTLSAMYIGSARRA